MHLLVKVQVEEASLAVRQHLGYHVQRVLLQRCGTVKLPAQHHVLSLLANDGGVGGSGERGHGSIFGARQVGVGLPSAKILVDGGYYLVRVEIARHADGHVVGAIISLEVVFDVCD